MPPKPITYRRARKKAAQDKKDFPGRAKGRYSEDLRISTINVWGPRAAGKREDLKISLYDYDVHICVVTGTHLLRDEVGDDLHAVGYKVPHSGGHHANKGGVAILLRSRVSGRIISDIRKLGGGARACLCLIYPGHAENGVVRLAGIYIPPSADATPHMLAGLGGPRAQTTASTGKVASHLLVGDFNPYTWKGKSDQLYRKWMGGSGLWEFSDPQIPTRTDDTHTC